jgi:hypothetical protein
MTSKTQKGGRSRRVSQKASATNAPSRSKDRGHALSYYQLRVLEFWNRPATKYVLGGIAAAAVIPPLFRALKRNEKVSEFIEGNMEAATEKFEEVRDQIKEKISDFRVASSEERTDARH